MNAFCLQGFAELQLFELGKALDAVLFTQFLERGHGLLFETAWSKQGFRIALARQSRSRLCADPTAALKLLFKQFSWLPMSLNLSMKIVAIFFIKLLNQGLKVEVTLVCHRGTGKQPD